MDPVLSKVGIIPLLTPVLLMSIACLLACPTVTWQAMLWNMCAMASRLNCLGRRGLTVRLLSAGCMFSRHRDMLMNAYVVALAS